MSTNQIVPYDTPAIRIAHDESSPALMKLNEDMLVPKNADKFHRSRLTQFAVWLSVNGDSWLFPNLSAYCDYLLQTVPDANGKFRDRKLSKRTIQAHLSTIRGRYRELIENNTTRDALRNEALAYLESTGQPTDPANIKAVTDEMLTRFENDLKPSKNEKKKVKVTVKQDIADSDHLRLTKAQADALIDAPGTGTLAAIRDTALIALLLSTGLREAELCDLEVQDLRKELGGELALEVRDGKGAKQRLVPFGDSADVLVIVETWLKLAGITEGPVFRGLYKGGKKLRPGQISERAIQQILSSHPIVIDGQTQAVQPHDCRRTYARLMWESGVPIEAIQDNLGHARVETTKLYIGTIDASIRRPPRLYSNLSRIAARAIKMQ